MSYKLRFDISQKILETLNYKSKNSSKLFQLCSFFEVRKPDDDINPKLGISLVNLRKCFDDDAQNSVIRNVLQENNFKFDQTKLKQYVCELSRDEFVKETLECEPNLKDSKPQSIIVEFSSPNFAKPFHAGHLRSTVIGGFIANLFKSMNHNVTRINYIGDWGTQFGYLKIGMDLSQVSSGEMKENPIRHLFNAYVKANQMGEADEQIAENARNVFRQLEIGEYTEFEEWNSFREYTLDELKRMYRRLGVEFDEYCWESQYRKQNIKEFLSEMTKSGILVQGENGSLVACVNDRRIPIVKSDGTTLYLTRDIAALKARSLKYKFDQIIYVVDNGQHDHFNCLFNIGQQLGIKGISGAKHIKFGRINKMSTRKGNVIFLKDILDEARDTVLEHQIKSPKTKIDVNTSDTDDILGVSAVIVNDLKRGRMKDYDFDWNNITEVNGDTGVKLQYTHCRLYSLQQKNNDIEPAQLCIPHLLCEPQAEELICLIAKYPEVIYKCQDTLEAFILVNYLMRLSHSVNRALKVLRVKDHPNKEVQQQRMLMFGVAKRTLHNGMKILGLDVLNEM